MPAQIAAGQQHVSRPYRIRCDPHPLRHDAHAAGVEIGPVAASGLDYLGVAGHHLHTTFFGSRAYGGEDAPQILHWEPLLEDQAQHQPQRPCAGHCQVVDRAVYREAADVAAGEEQRPHHEAVGGQGQASVRCIEHGGIGGAAGRGAQRRQDHLVQQLRLQPAAAPMREADHLRGHAPPR